MKSEHEVKVRLYNLNQIIKTLKTFEIPVPKTLIAFQVALRWVMGDLEK